MKGENTMYTILRVYGDFITVTETADNIASIFGACAVYAEDPNLIVLKVWNSKDGTVIVDYYWGA